jgi:membrane protein DedA with SNARE-associated domain
MSSYLAEVFDFFATHPHYAYWAVFLLALSEAIPIVGTVVPGSTLVLAISALAAKADINAWLLLVAAIGGCIAGDGFSFWLGQHYHQEILRYWPLNRFPRFIARSESFFNRYGAASVFLARFTAVVRAFVPLIAGILRMPAGQFYAANILSAVIWAPAHVFPGLLFGILVSLAGYGAQEIVVFVIAAMILGWALFRAVRWYLDRGILRWPGSRK